MAKLKDYEKWCFKVTFVIAWNSEVILFKIKSKQEEVLSPEFPKFANLLSGTGTAQLLYMSSNLCKK